MNIINSDGELLGKINIIDAVVVLLAVSLVVAGVAIASPFDSEESTTNATAQFGVVEFDSQPHSVAASIQSGDEIRPAGGSTMTVLDVYRTPASDGGVSVVALAKSDGGVSPIGAKQQFTSSTYRLNGTVTDTRDTAGNLSASTTNVTVETTLSPAITESIETGDEFRVAGTRVARIEQLQFIPTANGNPKARMVLALETRTVDGTLRFHEQPIRLGNTVPFRTNQYEFSGSVTNIGDPSLGIEQQETPVRLTATVPAATARSVTRGDTYELADQTVTRIDSVSVFPTNSSEQKRLDIVATLLTTDRSDGMYFLDQTVSPGSPIRLRTNEYSLSGTVVEQGADVSSVPSTTRTATVTIENVRPSVADSIDVGATERNRDNTYVRILSKETAPATVILTTDDGQIYRRDHPVNKAVTVTAELTVRETDSGVTFHGSQLQTGRTVVFDLGTVSVTGTVDAIQGP